MSSPVMTPPPIAPLAATASPVVCRTVRPDRRGHIFLLGTMRILSVGRLAHLFANYWPILLIIWGVIKLVEHMQAQREGTRSSGIGAGGVLLVVMIVVFGLIATQLERVNWSGVRDNFNFDDGDFPNIFGGETSTSTTIWSRIFAAGASLKGDRHARRGQHSRLG